MDQEGHGLKGKLNEDLRSCVDGNKRRVVIKWINNGGTVLDLRKHEANF